MKFFLVIFFLFVYEYIVARETKLESGFKDLQEQTVNTYNLLIKKEKEVKKLELEINKIRQKQEIFRSNIRNEEEIAQEIIFLLKRDFYQNSLADFFRNLTNNSNNFISDRIIKKATLSLIKDDVNNFLKDFEDIKGLEKRIITKLKLINLERLKLKDQKQKLNTQIKKKYLLQKQKIEKDKKYKLRQKKMAKNANNINDLFKDSAFKKKEGIRKKKNNQFIKLPVSGEIVSRFGERKDSFQFKNGIMFETKKEPSYIISPINGTVRFAGQFRSYGNLIIIENEDNYHSIISGMDKITIFEGNKVLKGEPVGKNEDDVKKKIYFELRYKGKAIDPKREVEIL